MVLATLVGGEEVVLGAVVLATLVGFVVGGAADVVPFIREVVEGFGGTATAGRVPRVSGDRFGVETKHSCKACHGCPDDDWSAPHRSWLQVINHRHKAGHSARGPQEWVKGQSLPALAVRPPWSR